MPIQPKIRRITAFKYTVPYRKGHGLCTLNVLPGTGGRATVFLQASNYRGFLSPTNCIEYVAAQICDRLKIEPKKLTLYEGPDPKFRKLEEKHPWAHVTFKGSKGKFKDASLGTPKWERLTAADWPKLFEAHCGVKFA